VYLAGTFHSIDGASRNALAAVDAVTGALDPSIDVDTNGVIEALLISGSTLYVGGQFSTFGDLSRNGLAAIDLDTGAVDSSFAPSTTGTVFALADSGSELYVGGSFTFIAGAVRLNVAALDPTTGVPDPQFAPFTVEATATSTPFNAPVDALSLSGSRLVIGGAFTDVDGFPRNNIAAVDEITGSIESDFNPDTDAQVYSLAVSPAGLIYAGGGFTSAPRVQRVGLAAVNASTGALLDGFAPPITASATAVEVGDGHLYAATRLTRRGDDVIALDPVTGAQVPNFTVHVSGSISALLYAHGHLYVAGSFGSINGVRRRNLAAVDPATGAVDPAFGAVIGANHDVDSVASALAAQGDELYVGGTFSAVDHRPRSALAAVDAATGRLERFDAELADGYEGPTTVSALQPAGARLYIGGSFSQIGGLPRLDLAAVDSGSGAPDPWFRANTNGPVAALAQVDGALLIGGDFTQIAGHRHRFAAELDLATGDPAAGFQPDPNDEVSALLGAPDLVALGGAFTGLSGVLQQHLAMYPVTASAAP
jgi:trimeric autotransporter adhesin